MASNRVLTIAAKMVGGRGIQHEAEEAGKGIKKLGSEVDSADKKAGSGHGWAIFSKQQKDAAKATKEHHSALKGAVGGMAKYAAAGIGAVGAVSLVKSAVTDVGETAEEIRKAHALGLTGDDRATMVTLAAYKQRGIGVQQLSMSVKGLSKAEFAASQQEEKYAGANAKAAAAHKPMTAVLGKQAEDFRKLGINITDFRKLSATDQLKELTKAFTNMPPSIERTRYASELLGKSGQKMLVLFTKGPLGLKGLEKAAYELIPKFKGGAKGFEEFEAAQLRMNLAVEGFKLQLGMALLPLLSKVMGSTTRLYANISHGKGVWKGVKEDVMKFVDALKSAYEWFKKSHTAQTVLIKGLELLAVAWAVEKVVTFVKWLRALWLVQKLIWVATKLWTGAQWLLNVALDANPIGAVVLAVTALAAAFYLAYTKVKWFRNGVNAVLNWVKSHWPIIAGVLLGPIAFGAIMIIKHWHTVLGFFKSLPSKFLKIGEEIGKGLWEGIKWGINAIIGLWEGLIHNIGLPGVHIGPFHTPSIHPFSSVHLPRLAEGGIIRSHGSVIVGDRGPEVLTLPPGARVNPLAGKGKPSGGILGAFSGSGGEGDLHVHVEINRQEIATAVLKEFRKLEARSA